MERFKAKIADEARSHADGELAEAKAEVRRLEAVNWRPEDWDHPPCHPSMAELWRSIGQVLLSQEYIGNEDLGERLDAARIKCPYGKLGTLWEDALSSDKSRKQKGAINLVTDIRKWVKKPGKNPALKRRQSKN